MSPEPLGEIPVEVYKTLHDQGREALVEQAEARREVRTVAEGTLGLVGLTAILLVQVVAASDDVNVRQGWWLGIVAVLLLAAAVIIVGGVWRFREGWTTAEVDGDEALGQLEEAKRAGEDVSLAEFYAQRTSAMAEGRRSNRGALQSLQRGTRAALLCWLAAVTAGCVGLLAEILGGSSA